MGVVKVFLLFLFVFSFPIKNMYISNVSYIAIFLLFLYTLFNKKQKIEVVRILKTKKIINIFLMLSILIGYSFFVVLISNSHDFSYISSLFSQILSLLGCILLFPLIKNKILNNIVVIFLIQSVIQFLSFISPKILILLNNFRSDITVQRGQLGYGNIRGLAISGSNFFGLAIAYGIVIIIIVYYNNFFIHWGKTIKLLIYAFIIFGGLSSGRYFLTSFVSLLPVFFIRVWKNNKIRINNQFKISSLIKVYIILISVLGAMVTVLLNVSNELLKRSWETFNSYVFQLLNNYKETGSLSTTSTSHLFNDMYFKIDPQYLLFGEGKYTNIDGTYYMFTDAGFMRSVLFFGLFGMFLLYLYQIQMFDWKKNKLLAITFIIFLTIAQIKGETIGYLIISQKLIFLIFLHNIFQGENLYERATN